MIVFLAAALERLVGYPQAWVDRIGHPVIWIGKLIGALDTTMNDPSISDNVRRARGVLALVAVVLATLVVAMGIQSLLRLVPLGWAAEIIIASSLIAQKGLRDAVAAVVEAIRNEGLESARHAVAQIVGRDTTDLDEEAISRAAIETLAENTSDGVIAPILFMLVFGLPGAAVYKAVNTADSMIGHMSDTYRDFGWAAAKIDDLLNFVPARLTALLFAAAAHILPGADGRGAWETARRDAPKHASPNAGWPEAAMAGALGFGLGGPRAYRGEMLDLPRMGSGRRGLEARDIDAALALYDRATLLTLIGLAAFAIVGLVL